ncbi:MAG TPA: class I SAM-dependent methyltransferase [Candidatus Saccharimonadales bacterium]|nr:class I SAM-dependent methyltransferase [Candidatus Saccharimonadales bacterium]
MSNYTVSFVPDTPNHCWNKAFDLIKDNSTVLDVGCSWGDFGRALKDYKKCVVDGVEPDKEDARKAKEKLRDVFNGFVEDAFNREFKERSYDHIVFLDVIEHLYDPVEVFKVVKKHLNPGGSVIFSIPNMAHLSVRLMLLKGDFEYGKTGLLDSTHLHYYTKKEIDRVFKEAGMLVNIWDYTEATYPEELVKKRLLELGLRANKQALDMLMEETARIFQFVGSAVVVSDGDAVERLDYSPNPQGQIMQEFQEKLDTYGDEITRQREALSSKDEIIHGLERKLSDPEYLAKQIRLSRYVKEYLKKRLSR